MNSDSREKVSTAINKIAGDDERLRAELEGYVDRHLDHPTDADSWLEVGGATSHDRPGGRHAFKAGLAAGLIVSAELEP